MTSPGAFNKSDAAAEAAAAEAAVAYTQQHHQWTLVIFQQCQQRKDLKSLKRSAVTDVKSPRESM
jgi:hypothetical protein